MEGLRAGDPLKAIAGRLGVSISSVATQQRRAQEKLGVRNKVDALRRWASHRKLYRR